MFTSVVIVAEIKAPFAAVAETVATKPSGAACTEFAEIAAVKTVAVSVTPRLVKQPRSFSTARFARAMATLIGNTVPLVQAIAISAATLNNKMIAAAMTFVAQGVKRGEGISQPLARTGMFPALASHLLTVGEETGKLDLMFARMADIYETDTRASIKRFTAIFEPLVILVMGVMVGALILSMLLAITSINDVAV